MQKAAFLLEFCFNWAKVGLLKNTGQQFERARFQAFIKLKAESFWQNYKSLPDHSRTNLSENVFYLNRWLPLQQFHSLLWHSLRLDLTKLHGIPYIGCRRCVPRWMQQVVADLKKNSEQYIHFFQIETLAIGGFSTCTFVDANVVGGSWVVVCSCSASAFSSTMELDDSITNASEFAFCGKSSWNP